MLPPNTYKVDDFETIRQTIFDDAYNALSKRFPLENDKYRLVVEDLGYDNIPKYTKLQQKEAIQSDKTLSAKLRGRWVLYDKATGKAVSRSPRKTIMDVPYMTERGTFIRNGTEMTLPIQMRLVPGVYTRVADNGEARAHINVRPGTGSQLSITMNPANPVFKVTQGTRNYKLYPLLKHMGISDEYLISAWGKDIYKANYDDFISGGGWYSAKTAAEENPYNEITKRVFRGELDPLETETALGKPFKTVDPDMMVAAATKLLKVTRGEAEPDNRDSLENQRFFMAPDLISERVRLDAGKVGQTLLWKLSRSGDVNKIPAGALNKYINGLFTESRLAQAIEETNPLDAYMRATKVTRMGEGGISGVETAPMSARLVQNTYKGFIDPTVSPECCANHLVMSNLGWVEISKVTEDTLVACLIDGKLEYHKPYKVVSYDFNGELYCYNATATAYEVTGNHRMWVCKIGRKARVHVDGRWRNEYKPQYKFEYAAEMHNTNRKLMAGGHKSLEHDIITSYTIGSGEDAITFNIGDWCEFLGWYISEGCYDHTNNSRSAVMITQDYHVNKENCDMINSLLTRMGVSFKYKGNDFKIKSRLIRSVIEPLGYCHEKFIPEEVFMAPEDAQLRFIDAILRGDGRKPKGNENPVLCTTSKQLAEDYERLLFNLGFATSVKFEKDDRESRYLGCYTIRHIANNDIWLRKNGTLSSKGKRQYPYFKKPYVGKVYCLSVPGGLFYTKLPGKRPFWIGNSLRAGLDSAIALNSVKGKDGFMYTPMINSISGKREYVNSLVASKSPVAFSEYRNSPQKYIPAMIGNKIEYMPKSQVKYFISNGDSLFALSSNLIPLKSGIKAGRLLMAQKHQTQAVSLTHRMAPYVQTVHPGDEKISVESSIGKLMGAVFSKGDGKVISVTPDEMTVRYMDGTKETISLYNNHPLNRKTLLSNEAMVKPGDIVKKGQVLASSNYTDENGVSALGTQLRTAWLPFKGENYLDAIIVSEDAAKKLTSEHFYHTGVDKDSGTTIGKNAYVAAFPTKFNKDQLATIDKDGLVKPGTMVKFGDPLILSYTKRDATPGSLHRALVKDGVVKWEHEFPGYVTDVVNSSKGVKVYTKAYLPLQTGDKCFSEDTDLLTETGWKNIKDVTLDDKIATLNPETNAFEYLTPVALHKIPYVGYMYTIDTPQVNTCVTPYHNNFVQTRNSDHFELIKAENCFNRRISFKKDGMWNGKAVETFTFPGLPDVKGFEDPLTIDMASYLVLLGMFLSEGSCVWNEKHRNYNVNIVQLKPDGVLALKAAENKYNIGKYFESQGRLINRDKRIVKYFMQFGHAKDKFIPNHVFALSSDQQRLLLDWLMWGDGTIKDGLYKSYTTISERLANDIQRLCLHIGIAAHIKRRKKLSGGNINGRPIMGKYICYNVKFVNKKLTPQINHGHVKVKQDFATYYNGYVYCPTMPKWNVVYTRRNGVPMWSGNCAARFANKGVTAKVVPTSEMPIAADGKPIDVIFGPTGIVSRVNSAQIVEAMLGKVAAKTGKRYVLPGFMDENMVEFAKRELANAGLTDREDVTDPTTGIVIPQVTVGNSYIVKMHHTAESKGGARATGSYTIDDQPGGAGHCFLGSVNVRTKDGYKRIAEICNSRKPVEVLTYDKETDSLLYKPVVDHFARLAKPDELWCIGVVSRAGMKDDVTLGQKGMHHRIRCTRNHEFYSYDGKTKIRADQLKPGDEVATPGYRLTHWQEQMLLGSMLGDGSFNRECFTVGHSIKQKDYLLWFRSKFENLLTDRPEYVNRREFKVLRLRQCGWISHLMAPFHENSKRKIIPPGIIKKMGLPGIAIWFADDGCCEWNKERTSVSRISFATHYFTIENIESAVQELIELTGLPWRIRRKTANPGSKLPFYPEIILTAGDSEYQKNNSRAVDVFTKMLVPYMPKSMSYKLGIHKDDPNVGSYWEDKVADFSPALEPCKIVYSAPYQLQPYESLVVYDFTVADTHNYFVHGAMVSNSSAKTLGNLVLGALIGHGSTEILKDMKLVKGQKNTDFWRDFKLGRTPVMPSTPLIYEKFLASLQGAGINVHKEKNTTNIFALTNSDINDFAKAEVKNSDTYSSQNMQPMPGGLFDPNIFGPDGTQWGYIKLDEPLLNPIMEDPIKLILGLTEADLEAVISGNKKLPNGLTGGIGLKKQLESINMKQAVQDALNDIKTATKTRRDKAVKKYRYLQSMANHGVSPADFMLDKVPVIPPRFRRITQSGDLTMVADANYLYRALMDNQQDVRDARNIGLPDDIVGSGNLKIYKAFKAITGISDPEDRKLQEKQVSGLLKWVFGKGTPKAGAYQRSVVGGTLDVAGRNVITPNSALRLDEVGLPEKEAWTLYQDFVIRRLVQNGMDPLVATKEVTNRTKLAEDALKQVVNERPVLLTRAPALHKYSIMAFRPRLVKGETIQLSPPIEKPFNADFDGDSQVGRVIVRFKRNIDVPFKYRLDF